MKNNNDNNNLLICSNCKKQVHTLYTKNNSKYCWNCYNNYTTVSYVTLRHEQLCNQARSIVEIKGRDYNRQEQGEEIEGDTLSNMRLAKHIGLAESNCQSVMIRLMDKMMRLKSLTKDPGNTDISISNESVKDTIKDAINYLVYLDIFYEEERAATK